MFRKPEILLAQSPISMLCSASARAKRELKGMQTQVINEN